MLYKYIYHSFIHMSLFAYECMNIYIYDSHFVQLYLFNMRIK